MRNVSKRFEAYLHECHQRYQDDVNLMKKEDEALNNSIFKSCSELRGAKEGTLSSLHIIRTESLPEVPEENSSVEIKESKCK